MNHSPAPTKDSERTMSFPAAVQKIIDGEAVTKLEWNNPKIIVLLKDGWLVIRKADMKDYTLKLSDGDMFGTDWVLAEKEGGEVK